jgi:hypothetical protein
LTFNIYGKTENSKHLCARCQHKIKMTLQNGVEIWRCGMFQVIIGKPVMQCDRFYEIGIATPFELESLAYKIDKNEDGEIEIYKPGGHRRIRIRAIHRRKKNPKPVIEETIQ